MNKVVIRLNKSGVRELLKSDEAKALVTEYAEDIARRAGAGYSVETSVGYTRARAEVSATTSEAIHDNYQNNTLLKAIK